MTFLPGPRISTTEITVAGADPTGVADSTAAFVAAADRAVAAGSNYVRVPRGTYHCPDMTATDMSDVYIVGDAKMTATTYVWPFSDEEFWKMRTGVGAKGGRGMIAITLDDGWDVHWSDWFPMTKDLGIVMGYAIPPERPRAWAKELWRHGNELIGHGDLNWGSATDAEREAQGQANVDMISAITGDSDNIAFVYPFHSRTDASDKIARKYFSRARGSAFGYPMAIDSGNSWNTAGLPLDQIASWEKYYKQFLHAIATGNQKMVFYFHYPTTNQTVLNDFSAFIKYAQQLGIQIVRPSDLRGRTVLQSDPRMSIIDEWTIAGDFLAWDDTTKWIGDRSLKITTGAGQTTGDNTHYVRPFEFINPCEHEWAEIRLSWRYKATAEITFSPASTSLAGPQWRVSGHGTRVDGEGVTFGQVSLGTHIGLYSTLAIGDWVEVVETMYLPPRLRKVYANLNINRVAENQTMWIDDVRMDFVRKHAHLTEVVTLTGTTAVMPPTYGVGGLYQSNRAGISITPLFSPAGNIYATVDSWGRIYLQSTDVADTGDVIITISPFTTYFPEA